MKRRIRRILGIFVLLSAAFLIWTGRAEPQAYIPPAAAPRALDALLQKESWSADDYRVLAAQTGLAPAALDLLRARGELHEVPAVQRAYLQPVQTRCTAGSLIPRSEWRAGSPARLAALEDGDILLTPCSHVFGWRNGHAALVVDAAAGVTLEAVVLGQTSTLRRVERWQSVPAVAVYRLRGADAQTRAAIARTARARLTGVPYSLTVGLFSQKRMPGKVTGTQCAHLVWEAFAAFGYDLDANGGRLVTPGDLARSPLLELKQVYGLPLSV